VLAGHETWFYRFSDARLRDAGDVFERSPGFAFVSDAIADLARVVTDTDRLARRDQERIGLWPERFICLPGCRAVASDSAEVTAGARPTRRRVLWASRLDPEKRPDLVPRIADHLAARDPGIRIEMHGRAVLSEFDTTMLAGRPNLTWHGGYAGFEALDAAAHDAFVFTSSHEGMPNAVLEAISAGLPVIAPDVGGIGEIIEDGVSGILLPEISDDEVAADAYADAIQRLVGDPALRRRLATEALRRLGRRHSPAVHACRVAALYAREGDVA
jgi:glycosyltransferase involved in cell wall biosynthesis